MSKDAIDAALVMAALAKGTGLIHTLSITEFQQLYHVRDGLIRSPLEPGTSWWGRDENGVAYMGDCLIDGAGNKRITLLEIVVTCPSCDGRGRSANMGGECLQCRGRKAVRP